MQFGVHEPAHDGLFAEHRHADAHFVRKGLPSARLDGAGVLLEVVAICTKDPESLALSGAQHDELLGLWLSGCVSGVGGMTLAQAGERHGETCAAFS